MMTSVFRSFRYNPDGVSSMHEKCAQLTYQSRRGRLRRRRILVEKKQFHATRGRTYTRNESVARLRFSCCTADNLIVIEFNKRQRRRCGTQLDRNFAFVLTDLETKQIAGETPCIRTDS